MKKILWVEDRDDAALDYIITEKLFEQHLTEDEIQVLNKATDIETKKGYLRNKDIYLEMNFYNACKRIFKEEFERIILDVNFPLPDVPEREKDEIQRANGLFVDACISKNQETKKKFSEIFDKILGIQEYSGLLLFFIICLYYEKEKTISDMADRICIFTGYDKNFNDIDNLLEQEISDRRISELEIHKYVRSVEERFWHKNNEGLENLKKFIQFDEYAYILERLIGQKAVKKYLHVQKNKDSEDSNTIAESLGSIRNIFENILSDLAKMPDVPKSYERRKKNSCDKKEEVKLFDHGTIKIRPFIGWLNETKKFECNILMKNFLFDIQEIASDFGPHDDLKDEKKKEKPSGYQPTANTVNALIYELREIILWLEKNMKNN